MSRRGGALSTVAATRPDARGGVTRSSTREKDAGRGAPLGNSRPACHLEPKTRLQILQDLAGPVGLLGLLAGALPAADAGRQVLDVGVAHGDRLLGRGLVRHALRSAAVGDDQGVLVLG